MLGKILETTAVALAVTLAGSAQTIPAGTHISVRVGQELSSGTAKVGNRFDATLARDLVVSGKTLAKAGAPARGKVPAHPVARREAIPARHPRRRGETGTPGLRSGPIPRRCEPATPTQHRPK